MDSHRERRRDPHSFRGGKGRRGGLDDPRPGSALGGRWIDYVGRADFRGFPADETTIAARGSYVALDEWGSFTPRLPSQLDVPRHAGQIHLAKVPTPKILIL